MTTRKLTLVLAFLFPLSIVIGGEQPQKVVSLVKQAQTDSWYETQANLWKQRTKSNAKDADAWLNYYTANRMLKIQAQTRTQQDLNEIVEEMQKSIPNSFEYNYVVYWNGGAAESAKNFSNLEKAYELAPNRPETYDDFFTYYMISDNVVKLEEIAIRWMNSNDISSGIYNWCFNTLMSCEPNAILVTSGDNDTYPALVLQLAKKIRPDVEIMNSSLLLINDYRKAHFSKAGIKSLELNWEQSDYEKVNEQLLSHLVENSKHRPLYFSIGCNVEASKVLEKKLFNVGLVWKYSDDKFDNIAVIKKNFEKVYMLDYIKQSFESDISEGVVKQMNANYLPAMLTLYNHYVESEDSRSALLKELIDKVAFDNNMQDQVKEVLGATNVSFKTKTVSDIHQILDNFVKINDTTYAMKTEVSNEMYELFLNDLLQSKRFEDLALAKNPAVEWRSLLSNELKGLSDEKLFLLGKPDKPGFPALNMSYEAAQMYCRWLTDVYNQIEHRKKPSEKAAFRLPTEKEWEFLALGGKEKRSYAWEGSDLRNAKGCYLANINTIDAANTYDKQEFCPSCNQYNLDGGLFTVTTGSYLVNEFGLYNMIGNVAEMVAEKGISKGGSWNTKGNDASILKSETYSGPNAYTGFRVVMILK